MRRPLFCLFIGSLILSFGCTSSSRGRGTSGDDPPREVDLLGDKPDVDKKVDSEAEAPPGWTCASSYYASDDGCDCGCGVLDPDCESSAIEACNYGYCGDAAINPDRNWLCESGGEAEADPDAGTPSGSDGGAGVDPPASGWSCNPGYFGTGDGCDCGCGVLDPDCATASEDSCGYEYCPSSLEVNPRENWLCRAPVPDPDPDPVDPVDPPDPSGWTCNTRFYGTGDGCDCGCGVLDPDCPSRAASACGYEYCPSGQAPTATDNTRCEAAAGDPGDPPPPPASDGCGLPPGSACSYLYDDVCAVQTMCQDDGDGFKCHDYCEDKYSNGVCNTGCFNTDPDCLDQAANLGRSCTTISDCLSPSTTGPSARGIYCHESTCQDSCEFLDDYSDGVCNSYCPTRDPDCGTAFPRDWCE